MVGHPGGFGPGAPVTPAERFRGDLEAHRDACPLLVRTVGAVSAKLPFLADSIALAAATYGEAWWAFSERHCRNLERLFAGEDRYRRAVEGYCRLSLEYLQLQRQLERTGRYALATFAEARERVYDNAEAMQGHYLDGLAFSAVFWPNHFGILLFYRDRFLPEVPDGARCLEVGPGHGLHTEALASARPAATIEAVDISPHALAYARRTLDAAGVAPGRVRLSQGDVVRGLPFPDGAFSAAVCGEVLEHLEDPGAALRELRRLTPGPVFLNVAVYAAAEDHIYLFHSVGEARDLIRRSGFSIGVELALPVRPKDDPETRDVPVNYACVARREA